MNSSFIGTLRANRINEYFRMPPYQAECSLVADLSLIYAVDLPYLHTSLNENRIKRVASLSKDAYFLLQMKLAWLMLRPTKDSKRYVL
jgi:hypothetical protein